MPAAFSGGFCGSCGHPLVQTSVSLTQGSNEITEQPAASAASGPPDGERKTVTAWFADIKGSMELIEDLDPEEARAIVDPALKIMIDAVRRYDGYIVQSTGDGIFALFGAPVAHEDHPQRALYVALRLQEELRKYSDKLRVEGKLPVQARVGMNSGEVVVRTIDTGEGRPEYTPIGHADAAARFAYERVGGHSMRNDSPIGVDGPEWDGVMRVQAVPAAAKSHGVRSSAAKFTSTFPIRPLCFSLSIYGLQVAGIVDVLGLRHSGPSPVVRSAPLIIASGPA